MCNVILVGKMVQLEKSSDMTESVHCFVSVERSGCVYIYISIIYALIFCFDYNAPHSLLDPVGIYGMQTNCLVLALKNNKITTHQY